LAKSRSLTYLRELCIFCEQLGLAVTLQKLRCFITKLENPSISIEEYGTTAIEISERLSDELDSKVCLMIDSHHASYYSNYADDWAVVIDRFPSSARDIEEASKCFTLNRYTACIYHLMRITENALKSIATRAGMTNTRPNWDEAIRYIEGQLTKNYQDMSALFKGDTEFLSGVAAHMRDVNVAWRRRVSHIERYYTEEEAQRIFSATKGLMEHISTKLSEVDAS
jgi:hypothetical protein